MWCCAVRHVYCRNAGTNVNESWHRFLRRHIGVCGAIRTPERLQLWLEVCQWRWNRSRQGLEHDMQPDDPCHTPFGRRLLVELLPLPVFDTTGFVRCPTASGPLNVADAKDRVWMRLGTYTAEQKQQLRSAEGAYVAVLAELRDASAYPRGVLSLRGLLQNICVRGYISSFQ